MYFRNALVRANYTNVEKNIYETTKYLEDFLSYLLFDCKCNEYTYKLNTFEQDGTWLLGEDNNI